MALSTSDRLLSILAPIILGIILAVWVRIFLKHKSIDLAQWSEFLVLKVLLPLFVIESLALVGKPADFLMACLIGFALPCVVLCGGIWLSGKTQRFSPELALMSATFGGGSRGSVIILLLAAQSGMMYEYLKWFVFVDLGSFLALLTVLSAWVRQKYRINAPVSHSGLRRLRQFLSNYAVITLLIVGVYFATKDRLPVLAQILQGTQTERKWLFSLLAFFALSLRFQAVKWSELLYDVLGLFAVRLLAVLLVWSVGVWWIGLSHPVWLVFVILAAMPPSSLVPALVAQAGADAPRLRYVNAFSGVMNGVYFLWVGLAIIASGFLC